MFNWGRRNDEFSWQKHIRTTVLFRRAKRRENLEAAKEAAVDGFKKAGEAGQHAGREGLLLAKKGADHAQRGMQTTSKKLAAAAVRCLAHLRALSWSLATNVLALSKTSLNWLARQTKVLIEKLSPHIERGMRWSGQKIGAGVDGLAAHLTFLPRQLVLPLLLIGLIAAAGAGVHVFTSGLGSDAMISTGIALVVLSLAALVWQHRRETTLAITRITRTHLPSGRRMPAYFAAGLLLAGATALTWLAAQQLPTAGSAIAALVTPEPPETFEGRATAVTGDTLRIQGKTIQLAGIEAPDLSQRCKRSRKRSWRCGRDARRALARLIRKRTITCESIGHTDKGRVSATCKSPKTEDLAATLVTSGHVFASNSSTNTYGDLEDTARERKRGIWRGKPLRPAEFRAVKWDAAKRKSPDGCPIKGRVLRSGRKYVLPWSPGYRKVRVRNSRGERWFCSEEEAIAAGWQPVGSS